ncbi:caspase domain-containing protein [Mycena latifolia]|nr:caspase domain-containing protein [Mycena latifolia]
MDSRQGSSTGCEADLPTPESSSSSSTTLHTGRKRALLVGIRTTHCYPELKAAHADVQKMRALLMDLYHYAADDIRVLIDDGIDGHVQPTRANILQAIAELVKDVKDGDHRFFHYSGHSTQVVNQSKSEEDRKDECLVPLDGEDTTIIHNELYQALINPLPAGAHLVAVLDTCHSGSLLDLPHYRCDRVFVPWVNRGRRTREELRPRVVRRGALLLSPAGVNWHSASTPTPMPTRSRTRRSIMSVMSNPQAPVGRPFAHRRSARIGSRAPKKADANALPDSAQPTWFLPEDKRRCESPVGHFKYKGWSLKARADAEPVTDVFSLASTGNSRPVLEDEDGWKSIASALVELLRENPNRSLEDVLVSVSHATYTMARHECEKINKLARLIGGLECGRRSTPSLVHSELPALVRTPTFPPGRKSLAARTADTLTKLKQRLRDSPLLGGHDMDAFQNPELASARPLDMERQWRM